MNFGAMSHLRTKFARVASLGSMNATTTAEVPPLEKPQTFDSPSTQESAPDIQDTVIIARASLKDTVEMPLAILTPSQSALFADIERIVGIQDHDIKKAEMDALYASRKTPGAKERLSAEIDAIIAAKDGLLSKKIQKVLVGMQKHVSSEVAAVTKQKKADPSVETFSMDTYRLEVEQLKRQLAPKPVAFKERIAGLFAGLNIFKR